MEVDAIPAGLCNLQISGGVWTPRRLLSCTLEGDVVNLWCEDDQSGRQKWKFYQVPDYANRYWIAIQLGPDDIRYLTVPGNGTSLTLRPLDEEDRCQQWTVTIDADSKMRIRTVLELNRSYLSCTPEGSVDLWIEDDHSGRQVWQWVAPPVAGN